MPEDGIETLSRFDAIYLGAVGYPGVPDHISLWDLLLVIRQAFDQYVNLRPIKLLNGAPCPLKDAKLEDIDMIVVGENSEGEYAGQGNWLFEDSQTRWFTNRSILTQRYRADYPLRLSLRAPRKRPSQV